MSEAGLHPLEMILRLCAAVAPQPWYPRLFAKQEGVDREELGRCLEELWLSGLIERSRGTDETGPAITLTREGQRVLLDPEALERLRAGQPISATDRAAVVRQALTGRARPIITITLVLLNVVVFALGYFAARDLRIDQAYLAGPAGGAQQEILRIYQKLGSMSAYELVDGQWWRLLTTGFVHAGFLHLLMNMVFLFLAGRFIEQIWGHVRYLAIYLASVLGGSVLAVVHNVGVSVGASAGVCGLLGAEAVWFFFNRRYLPRAVVRRARMVFLINLVLLVFLSSFKGVGAWGHFGGAVSGAMTALLLQLHRFGPPLWRWLAMIGFVPMAWYGHHAIEQARATDPNWQAVEDQQFADRHANPILKATRKAQQAYAEKVKPVLDIHPIRRDPAKVEAVYPVVEEQKRELTALLDGLNRAGPYHSPEAREAREASQQYLRAEIELFNQAEHILQLGEKRTGKDRQALREQEEEVEEQRREWRNRFQLR